MSFFFFSDMKMYVHVCGCMKMHAYAKIFYVSFSRYAKNILCRCNVCVACRFRIVTVIRNTHMGLGITKYIRTPYLGRLPMIGRF